MDDARGYGSRIKPLLGTARAYARAVLRDRHDAQDAVQEAALRGLERLETFDVGRSFKAWWLTIVRHCCMDLLRRASAARTEPLDDSGLSAPDAPDPDGWEALAGAMAQLSEAHREILRLRYFADLSYSELAEALQIPPGTVMSRLHLARKALKACMKEESFP